MAEKRKILVVVTNVGAYEKVGMRTGLWLGELTHFWDVAEKAGFTMDVVSPRGGLIPLDPESLSHEALAELGTGKRYADREFMDLLDDTGKIADVDMGEYDAIYLTGGHGVMFDFPQTAELEALIARFHDSGRIVSSVCHGATGLLNVTLETGDPLVRGRRVTGFSWPEEELADRAEAVPYNLQEELKRLGAEYSTADEPFAPYVVEDDNLVTGQNPGSAKGVGETVVRRLATV
ncbi:type 1 glutamine amidotransferase domain-containing protein [Streptomyces sp. NPDC014734]|uniref:type 1 glutamine amidotransferase domain-containing protein n=1 Tax=Streptomyces sp. NPDC014734 TaxID=3364886 RepID=UPI00370027D8